MKQRLSIDAGAIRREFAGVKLGDKRLEKRALEIVSGIAPAPADSFPEQMSSVAEREALYRFLSNPKVTMAGLLEGHIRATRDRVRGRSEVRVIHDTTTFRFAGDREGLGIVRGEVKGFYGHVTLAVAADETREPLGVLGLHPFIHADAIEHRGLSMTERARISKAKPRAEKESSRWEKQAIEVSEELPDGTRPIHVMDQEADDFVLIGELQAAKLDFVVRGEPQRRTTTEKLGVKDVLARRRATVFRNVRLSPRSKRKSTKKNPPREEREAELHLRWGTVTLPRGNGIQFDRRELSVTAVHVFEPNPPADEVPIEWMLFTSLNVESVEEAAAVVDHYRARWIVEEYFKALKTGCAFEKRQLTSFDGLTRALALFVPIAWQLLLLRHLTREAPARSADSVFDQEQLLLLRTLLEARRYAFARQPRIRDVMLGVAALGGHIANNGDPGWLVLGRGYTRFLEAEVVWRLARKCDQS